VAHIQLVAVAASDSDPATPGRHSSPLACAAAVRACRWKESTVAAIAARFSSGHSAAPSVRLVRPSIEESVKMALPSPRPLAVLVAPLLRPTTAAQAESISGRAAAAAMVSCHRALPAWAH